ncbi:MAG: uroporphyrinogen-III C-methyltransferase [Nitrososphaeria archaeon]|nr:uroporphyrinogen-III C-methyltransferase [Nitrososphaeria archaeon]NIQ33239.1 uroporphyrinogen-III C-methyltransferase [Nitrososphaeria archaeon]
MSVGRVWLIGAGPGDPGLISVKGLRKVRDADVVVYDRLVSKALLEEARPEAELIDVGKSPKHHRLNQDEIEQLLIMKAQEGKKVVRLKGGDPCVLGRGGEELVALAEAGIEVRVVPGISSALAAPECAGIPVTYRGKSSSFAVVTGREAASKDEGIVDLESMAKAVDTIIVLMSVGVLEKNVGRLLDGGLEASTPAAVIEWGTTEKQRVIEGTLHTIVEAAHKAGVRSPAVLVVGQVVEIRQQLKKHLGCVFI